MKLDINQVAEALRQRMAEAIPRRQYREFDRKIGRADSGWTGKFMRSQTGPPSLEGLLKILQALNVHPADFFAEVYPRGSEDEAVRDYLEEFTKQMRNIAEEVFEEKQRRKRKT